MQGKGKRRVAAAVEVEAGGEGILARIVERAIDNPAMTGGLFVMALTATAIVSNAMLLQHGRHPEPLFMTRPVDDAPVPLPRVRAPQAAKPAPAMPEPAAAPAAAVKPVPDIRIVASLQKALARRGLYKGALDGIAGSRTRAAVAAYEKSAGLPVTGEPSADILDRITTASISPAAKAPVKPVVAAPPKRAVVPPAVIPGPAASIEPATDVAPVTKMPLGTPPAPAPAVVAAKPATPVDAAPAAAAPVVTPAAPAGPDPAVLAAQLRYQQVQDALNRIGYGPLAVTGGEDDETANAIRRFELDNGLPISGKAGDRVLARLRTIGAMAAN